jgi:4-amino-4-deoxy-L-arabinose transferase-like glycosyltransferase
MTNTTKNINNIYYIFITAHLVFWTLIPSLTNQNLPLDTIEALAWGSNLDWGFNKHPPMSAFFPEVFYQIFGSQDWAYYLLSQIFVLIAFYYVFKFSKEFFNNDLLGLISVLLIESIYFYNFTTPEFNVNVCQLPFWSLTVYFSWKIYTSKEIKFTDCFLVGLFAALGFLSKYLFLYLLVSIDLLFIYLIFIKKERKFDFKYLITVEVFLIVLVPHLIWLNNNEFITITYGLARTGLEQSSLIDHIKFPLVFLLNQVGLLIPFLILVWLLIKKIKFKFDLKDKRLLFLLAINILPILLMFLTFCGYRALKLEQCG